MQLAVNYAVRMDTPLLQGPSMTHAYTRTDG